MTNERVQDPEAFDATVHQVCDLYGEATTLKQQGVHLISTDEKTGIQALERKYPILPMQPGLIERCEFEYIRHGTLCLMANFEVTTGRVIAPSIGPTRKEADFARHIEQTIETDASAGWIFIVDQLNTHMSETLVRCIAARCSVEVDLGIKGKQGILQSKKTRKQFLEQAAHRIRFVYTPKHTSWLNQVEIWFSILVRRVLKRGTFKSVAELRARILAFIAYFNETMAKPFKWTYKGRPLVA